MGFSDAGRVVRRQVVQLRPPRLPPPPATAPPQPRLRGKERRPEDHTTRSRLLVPLGLLGQRLRVGDHLPGAAWPFHPIRCRSRSVFPSEQRAACPDEVDAPLPPCLPHRVVLTLCCADAFDPSLHPGARRRRRAQEKSRSPPRRRGTSGRSRPLCPFFSASSSSLLTERALARRGSAGEKTARSGCASDAVAHMVPEGVGGRPQRRETTSPKRSPSAPRRG